MFESMYKSMKLCWNRWSHRLKIYRHTHTLESILISFIHTMIYWWRSISLVYVCVCILKESANKFTSQKSETLQKVLISITHLMKSVYSFMIWRTYKIQWIKLLSFGPCACVCVCTALIPFQFIPISSSYTQISSAFIL